MSKPAAFWDSSALVPLCVDEAPSREAHSYLGKFAVAVWWGSQVEVHSAICRAHRLKQLSDLDKGGALARLRSLADTWREIVPTDELRELAAELLDSYPLRGADALQLAASLVWCARRPARRIFISGDRRLSEAAASAGFAVIGLHS